jgi:hypothetical protein
MGTSIATRTIFIVEAQIWTFGGMIAKADSWSSHQLTHGARYSDLIHTTLWITGWMISINDVHMHAAIRQGRLQGGGRNQKMNMKQQLIKFPPSG